MKKTLKFFAISGAILLLAACSGKKDDRVQGADPVEDSIIAAEQSGDALPAADLDNQQFKIVDNLIISDNLPVVVDFFATWCGPCKQYAPVYHAISKKFAGQALFVSIDIDEYPEVAKAYGITSIPTTVFIYNGGGVMGSETGVLDEETLGAYVDQLLASTAGTDMSI